MRQELWGFWMQWRQLDHMQTICTSCHTDNDIYTSLLNFYRPDLFLTPNQQCQSTEGTSTEIKNITTQSHCPTTVHSSVWQKHTDKEVAGEEVYKWKAKSWTNSHTETHKWELLSILQWKQPQTEANYLTTKSLFCNTSHIKLAIILSSQNWFE